VVDADITSFFDEINHQVLLREVKQLLTDQAILHLVRLWLAAVVIDGPQRFRLLRGVPQGSPISPLLANLYLDQLDEAALNENLRLIRFADDFLILCRHKQEADKALEFTAQVLESLRLQLHDKKTRVVDFRHGFRFLGVEFVRSLAIKAKYPEIELMSLETEELGTIPEECAEIIEPGPRRGRASAVAPAGQEDVDAGTEKARIIGYQYPKTELALAFAEAGIKPAYFPEQEMAEGLPEDEDEPEQVMAVEPPVSTPAGAPADLDPRLRTLSWKTVMCWVRSQSVLSSKKGERSSSGFRPLRWTRS
jgi:CRISPR-associated protein Cas1